MLYRGFVKRSRLLTNSNELSVTCAKISVVIHVNK